MEREIKFRGKVEETGDWIFGWLFKDMLSGRMCIQQTTSEILKDRGSMCIRHSTRSIDPNTVGQYTPLKDKNGKEIYDGDILNWDYSGETEYADWMKNPIYYVTYDEGYRLCAKSLDQSKKLYLHAFRFKHTEVVGNIHDNSELINGN